MSNADELLADARAASSAFRAAKVNSLNEWEAACKLINAFNLLDDHMNDGGPPPADWTGAR